METWRIGLRAARDRLGLSRDELARRTLLAASTIKAYELGTRHPTREHLGALIEALQIPRAEGNEILAGAGYATAPTLFPPERFPAYFYTVDELQDTVEHVPWPEFVLNDNLELVAANVAACRLWGIDMERERAMRTRVQWNLLTVAADRRFADRVANWDEVVTLMAAVAKGRPLRPETLDQPSDYFSDVLAEFARGDPAFLARLIAAWNAAAPQPAKCRWSYRIVWDDPEFGAMRFLALVSTASEPDALGFNDWHPLDAATWDVLERVKRRAAGAAPA